MSEKITLEAVLPIAAQVFNALPKDSSQMLAPEGEGKDRSKQYAELFAKFALTVHQKINSGTQNTP